MSYVLETTDDNGDIKYISVGECTVYCPEYATRYEDKKSAMTVAAALTKATGKTGFIVKKLSTKLCLQAYARNRTKAHSLLYPNNFKK